MGNAVVTYCALASKGNSVLVSVLVQVVDLSLVSSTAAFYDECVAWGQVVSTSACVYAAFVFSCFTMCSWYAPNWGFSAVVLSNL